MLVQTLILRHGKEKIMVFHQIKVIDGAKDISSALMAKVVFIPNVVPGDVIDVQTLKSASLIMKSSSFS
jgi:tRNA/tmRNA/rRNA uracil-C5-methylase (TrmA/RlmC/RlmD family)